MNCDNFLSERSSTRLNNAQGGNAGGRSQLGYMFGGEPENAGPKNGGGLRGRRQEQEVALKPGQRPPQASTEAPAQKTVEPSQPQSQAAPSVPEDPAAVGFGARKKIGSNSFASGSNQNQGNFLTDRPTSRVLAPPGGGSQITFG